MPADELALFEHHPDRMTAEVVAGRLRAAGLRPLVQADDFGGVVPAAASPRGVRLLLPRSEHAPARELLASTPDVSDVEPDGPPPELPRQALPPWILVGIGFFCGLFVGWLLS